MAISVRMLRSFLPALVCTGIVLAACSSDSEDSPKPDVMEPEPSSGGSDTDGGGTGGTVMLPGEAGSPPLSNGGVGASGEPGTAGTPSEPMPGTAGGGGSDDPGTSEPTPGFKSGLAIYTTNCVMCHAPDLGGLGVFANISADMVNGIGSWTDEEIRNAIVNGKDPERADLCSLMVPFSNMTDSDLADLIEYLRGAPPSNRKITAQCPK
jgi:mono/diheme cytochrome c family protein